MIYDILKQPARAWHTATIAMKQPTSIYI